MAHVIRTTVAALLVAALFSAPAEGQPDKIITIKGTVKKVQVEKKRVSILVQADEEVWFHVGNDRPVTQAGKKAKPADLKVGQKVTIRTKNIQLDSLPPQMFAESVVIDAEAKKN